MKWMSHRRVLLGLFPLAGVLSSGAGKAEQELPSWTLTVTAPQRDYREVPVSVTMAKPEEALAGIGTHPVLRQGETGPTVPCQVESRGDQVRLWWIVHDLRRGEPQTFQLTFEKGQALAAPGVEVKEIEGGVEVSLDGQLFTRYLTATGPKPICYPIIGPTGQPITRNFPMQQVAGEPQDHPHQRSLWFTQDEVNGVNFWAEGEGTGRQVHREYEALESGPIMGLIRARNDWVRADGTKVLEDTRELRVYHVANGRLFDFDVTLRATEGPVEFGDTKEGTFGIRLTPSMQLAGGGGHIENARGLKDHEAWGKPAEWCDYYGPVGGGTVGVAILNHPTSFRFPTYWHVRDYGLFAANPFGLRDFTGDQSNKGQYSLEQGQTLAFRYRVFLHHGDTASARVADVYAAYAEPPEVEVLFPMTAAPEPFAAVQSTLAEACAVFSGFDHNGDGIAEIERLGRVSEGAAFSYERPGNGRGLVLVIVEERLWEPGIAPDLRPSLATYVADLAAEGYDACLITASVYAGEKHQDGRTVLALRAFLRRLAASVPGFQGAVLVGNFPEAFLVRQYFWRIHGPVTIHAGQPDEEKFEEPVDYWRTRAEPIAMRSELVLADLDGRWDEVYHEATEEMPYAIAVFPEGAEAAGGVTEHYEFGTDRFVDFFFIQDGRWEAEPAGPGRLRFAPLPQRDDECAPSDLALPNPMCRPEISVSRINAYHAGVDPSPEVKGTSGEGLLDANGKPQTVTFADKESTSHPLHIWTPSPGLERRLLLEYFERNHRYRQGGYADACKPACIGTEWDSSLPEILQAFAPAEGDPTGLGADPGEGYDVHGGQVELVDFVRWMKRPALLRVVKAHTDPWGSTFGACTDLDALHTEVGGTIWHWKRAENVLTPSLEQESGKASFALDRTLWENRVLPEAANMFLHTGCDSISPEGTNSWPYNAPRYGFWQGAECLLMYGQGLVLFGRAKVFNDEPRELFQTLAAGGTWGEAWRRYFEVEAQDPTLTTLEQGIRQKKAYFWSLIGDWTATVKRTRRAAILSPASRLEPIG